MHVLVRVQTPVDVWNLRCAWNALMILVGRFPTQRCFVSYSTSVLTTTMTYSIHSSSSIILGFAGSTESLSRQ